MSIVRGVTGPLSFGEDIVSAKNNNKLASTAALDIIRTSGPSFSFCQADRAACVCSECVSTKLKKMSLLGTFEKPELENRGDREAECHGKRQETSPTTTFSAARKEAGTVQSQRHFDAYLYSLSRTARKQTICPSNDCNTEEPGICISILQQKSPQSLVATPK